VIILARAFVSLDSQSTTSFPPKPMAHLQRPLVDQTEWIETTRPIYHNHHT